MMRNLLDYLSRQDLVPDGEGCHGELGDGPVPGFDEVERGLDVGGADGVEDVFYRVHAEDGELVEFLG